MTMPTTFDMAKATRLTREGRLAEAVAVLTGKVGSSTTSEQRPATQASAAPPSVTGSAWGSSLPALDLHGPSGPRLPTALKGVLDRMQKIRVGDGLLGSARADHVAPSPEGARFEEHTFVNAAGSRSYKLYVPSGHRGEALPLVVMLHGCTQSPDDFAAGTRMNDLAEEEGFLVAYPAQLQSANASKCWNWFRAADQSRDSGEPSLIAGLTRQIIHDWPVDTKRVYVAGLSAGGAAAAIMGQTYPDLYAAIGVHSGLACGAARDMSSAFTAMRQGGSGLPVSHRGENPGGAVPTIVFHGDRDGTVNPINGDQVIAQSKAAAGLRTTVDHGEAPGGISYTCTVQYDERERPVLEHWVLHGVGHAWSGGSPDGSYTEPHGPNASREMMRFFRQHVTPSRE